MNILELKLNRDRFKKFNIPLVQGVLSVSVIRPKS